MTNWLKLGMSTICIYFLLGVYIIYCYMHTKCHKSYHTQNSHQYCGFIRFHIGFYIGFSTSVQLGFLTHLVHASVLSCLISVISISPCVHTHIHTPIDIVLSFVRCHLSFVVRRQRFALLPRSSFCCNMPSSTDCANRLNTLLHQLQPYQRCLCLIFALAFPCLGLFLCVYLVFVPCLVCSSGLHAAFALFSCPCLSLSSSFLCAPYSIPRSRRGRLGLDVEGLVLALSCLSLGLFLCLSLFPFGFFFWGGGPPPPGARARPFRFTWKRPALLLVVVVAVSILKKSPPCSTLCIWSSLKKRGFVFAEGLCLPRYEYETLCFFSLLVSVCLYALPSFYRLLAYERGGWMNGCKAPRSDGAHTHVSVCLVKEVDQLRSPILHAFESNDFEV